MRIKIQLVTKGSVELENIEDAKDKGAKDKKGEKKSKKTDVSLLIASIKYTGRISQRR